MSAYCPVIDVESSLPLGMTLPERRAYRAAERRSARVPFLQRPLVVALLAMCALLAAIGTATYGAHTAMAASPKGALLASPHTAPTCAEDDPCWTWSRMGNRKRGIVTVRGNLLVVGPCQYARMHAAHRIDAHTPRLRGDAWARAHGCER